MTTSFVTDRPSRRLVVRHATTYSYDNPVIRSKHRLHVKPIHDHRQSVLSYTLKIAPDIPIIEYEDVFGNWATRFEINQPYTQLKIEAISEIELRDTDPFAFANVPIRPTFPLVWMPWELKMLTPYLTPQELADTQLSELYDYALSFVNKNQGDLMETLFNINLTLFRDYRYVPGSTSFATTAFDVYLNKRGVCQDFANLFITLARLMGIPARYVCGYIYTGNVGETRAQSDASHAWVQLYIPNVGWKGFDPTNGILPGTDHVRVGVGRHYRDVAPTSGTIYSPAFETMHIDVEVKEADLPPINPPVPPSATPIPTAAA